MLAVVVNTEGFLKYSQIFEGSIADSKTLDKIIAELSVRTSATGHKPVVLLDAGIATKDNPKLLKKNKFEYLCVSRSGMNEYTADANSKPISITDKKKQPLTLQRVNVTGSNDTWLRVHSQAKGLKESGMNSRFSERFEHGLTQIKESLDKKGGVKKQRRVWERIGRLKAKYPSMGKRYDIDTKSDTKGKVTGITWKQKLVENKEVHYLLRTNLDQKDEKTQWNRGDLLCKVKDYAK